jgi:hypothetical protein
MSQQGDVIKGWGTFVVPVGPIDFFYVPISCEIIAGNTSFGSINKKRSRKVTLHVNTGESDEYGVDDALEIILVDDGKEHTRICSLRNKGNRDKLVTFFNTGHFNMRRYHIKHSSPYGPFRLSFIDDDVQELNR